MKWPTWSWLVIALEILAWPGAVVSGVTWLTAAEVVSREQAEIELKRPLPSDWKYVFIDHRIPTPWPHPVSFRRLGGYGFLVCLTVMILSEASLYLFPPNAGLILRMIRWAEKLKRRS